MSAAPELVVTDLPSCAGWDFGGHRYALEPLTLPFPETAGSPVHGRVIDPDLVEACADIGREIRRIGDGELAVDLGDRSDVLEELYWFRWITGHQICFVIWRLLAQLVEEVTEDGVPLKQAVAPLATYVRGYCIMLLYTGSCPRSVYESLIRPSMRLRHPSFSGHWAPDYWQVRTLFRGQSSGLTQAPDAAELRRSIRLHEVVHEGIAAKLVPDGKSLLRKSRVRGQDPRLLHVIYDNYFMTLRAPVAHADVIAQLLRRLVAVAQDVATNDLYCNADDELERPPELRSRNVFACEIAFVDILADVAACAAGRPDAYPALREPAGATTRHAGTRDVEP